MEDIPHQILWFFVNADPHAVMAHLLLPITVGLCFYQSHYPYVLLKALWERSFGDGFRPLTAANAPALGMTMPTLLRSRSDLQGLRVGIRSLLGCGYPGHITFIVVIDGRGFAPDLYRELCEWVASLAIPAQMHVEVIGTPERVGKAMAGDVGVQQIVELAKTRAIPQKPPVYFNMDADCELGPFALERMVQALTRPSRLTGRPGNLVTSHVSIREKHYLPSFGALFTLRGLISLSVAREYLVAIGLGRINAFRILPQNGASGALYCTWFPVVELAASWASFLASLRARDYAAWWLGAPPPRFDPAQQKPLPEAMTGMGEDTWMSWLACAARIDARGELQVALPRTPLHAVYYAAVAFFARPFRYDPHAKVYTTTPTTIRGLFQQRIRWNVSRIWTVQCWWRGLGYHLSIGLPVVFDVILTTTVHLIALLALLLLPFSGSAAAIAPAFWVLIELGYFIERVISIGLAMLLDREKGQWKKALALPMAGTFHLLFNVATTAYGFWLQVLGNGYNDGFCPESTLVRGGTSRIALLYRTRRFFALAVRSLVYGDVPLGRFWFGWHATPWTPNGYEGWTTGNVPPTVKATRLTSGRAEGGFIPPARRRDGRVG